VLLQSTPVQRSSNIEKKIADSRIIVEAATTAVDVVVVGQRCNLKEREQLYIKLIS